MDLPLLGGGIAGPGGQAGFRTTLTRADCPAAAIPVAAITRVPVLTGLTAFADHYAKHRFTLPALHAEVANRIVAANTVVDHERITGLAEGIVEGVAVYKVIDGKIRTVWFFQEALNYPRGAEAIPALSTRWHGSPWR